MTTPNDTFVWRFTAFDKKVELLQLRQTLIDARLDQTPIAISELFRVLPISTPQRPQAEARGQISVSGSNFSNSAADELWMQCIDPAMGEVFITAPAEFKAEIPEPIDVIQIRFPVDAELGFEVPLIEQLGVNRSKFQKINEIEISETFTITKTFDEGDPSKRTEVFVLFEQALETATLEEISSLAFPEGLSRDAEGNPITFRSTLSEFAALGVDCNFGIGDGQWYVLRRRNDGICFVHDTQNVPNTEVQFQGTREDCDTYFANNCPDTFC